jgi:hypothetical protein
MPIPAAAPLTDALALVVWRYEDKTCFVPGEGWLTSPVSPALLRGNAAGIGSPFAQTPVPLDRDWQVRSIPLEPVESAQCATANEDTNELA